MIRIEKNFSAKSFAFNFPILSFLENAGVKAELKAPSAKILLNMLGILKATKKASVIAVAPNKYAITTSLISPKTLLEKMETDIIAADFTIDITCKL